MQEVGTVRFESTDGSTTGERFYAKHWMLRPFQIAWRGQWHEQNRKDGDVWVYRATGLPGQTMASDPALKEIE